MEYQCPKEYRRNRKREVLELLTAGAGLIIVEWSLLLILFI